MVTIGLALAAGILMIASLQAFTMTIQHKTRSLFRQLQGLRQAAMFDMVASRVAQELKQRYQDSSDISKVIPIENPRSLNHLLRPTSRLYNPAFPRIFGKGQFQIDLINTGPGPASSFVAPETDINVFIAPTIGNGYYLVTIQTSLCRDIVVGRVRFPPESVATPNPGLGLPWNIRCPAGQIVPVTHTIYVNINSPTFNS